MATNILEKKPNKKFEWRAYENGSLLENGIALNKSATFIWNKCDGKHTVSEIIKALSKEYGVEFDLAKKDTLDCINILVDEGCLHA